MRPFALLVVLGLALPLPADASPKGERGNGHGNGRGAWIDGELCPPGLRRRDPACVPPGRAREDDGADEEGDGDDGADFADRIERELGDLAERADLSRDEAQALAIIGGLMGLALQQQRAREASDAYASVPTVARLAIPEAPPLRPAWIEALAPTYFGDAAASDGLGGAAATEADLSLPPRVVAAAPLASAPAPSSALIPPPPPMAEDVSDLVGGSVTDSGF